MGARLQPETGAMASVLQTFEVAAGSSPEG